MKLTYELEKLKKGLAFAETVKAERF